jgi:hypothetical protein
MDSFSAYILFGIASAFLSFLIFNILKKDKSYKIFRAIEDGFFLAYPILLTFIGIVNFYETKVFSVHQLISKLDTTTIAILLILGIVACLHIVFEKEKS